MGPSFAPMRFSAAGLSRTGVATALVAALATMAALASPTASHIANSTAGITHDLYTPAGQSRCVYGPDNCSLHSFTYVSANNFTGANQCAIAEIYKPSDHSQKFQGFCENLSRLCIHTTHDPYGELHCNDQDANMWHAGARTGAAFWGGLTIRRHAIY